jgi:hypothetical protein
VFTVSGQKPFEIGTHRVWSAADGCLSS